jgi:hypothetical protein
MANDWFVDAISSFLHKEVEDMITWQQKPNSAGRKTAAVAMKLQTLLQGIK